jgi:hypothetical protein
VGESFMMKDFIVLEALGSLAAFLGP